MALAGCVNELFAELPLPEITAGRSHRKDSLQRRMECLAALTTNVALLSLSPAQYDGLAVPLKNSKMNRYQPKAFNADILRSVVAGLGKLGLVVHDSSVYKQRRTVLHPTDAFRKRLKSYGVTISAIGRTAGRETIELSVDRYGPQSKETTDYSDTEQTIKLRGEMAAINRMLAKTEIRYDGDMLPPGFMVRKFQLHSQEAPPTFDLHGRLYGGTWQNLPKEKRYLLSVNGESLADLDYSSMFIQLAYHVAGQCAPQGDLYAIPGLELHRKAVKSALVSLLFRKTPAARLPTEVRKQLPLDWDMPRFKAAAAVHHAPIAHLFDTNVGHRLMALEGNILVDVLLRLTNMDVPALPMHDGIMVPQSRKHEAQRVMEEVSAEHLGRALPVVEKPIRKPPSK
ncbi:Hypothetical protein RG1141_PA02230 (plasmid) [Neorhizobium galegae bv. officinalis bv. officinalis str. HAMBI 1141]|uniref:Uncharacterized protein n=2 Tax=Neorhizobium galegae TaxID=399 RepID=A0A068TF77_NEOGA|nr:Hypothetical protein RG1141_PA02230 [Neorhizobium galegae bv. officinalis bv. officinalis str. HAMBI 1141]